MKNMIYLFSNTNKCIPSVPSEGYYLVNATNGLYSPCHSACRACKGGFNETHENCTIAQMKI